MRVKESQSSATILTLGIWCLLICLILPARMKRESGRYSDRFLMRYNSVALIQGLPT